jgi:diaminohydroxyphosphoribosylaminopyrimidine deaminase/5-amino-6-(5-phosphoribosylamino)uracil reductase
VVVVPGVDGRVDLEALFEELGRRGFVDVLCEGGPELGTALLRAGLAGRLELHVAPILLGSHALRLGDLGVRTMSDADRWSLAEVRRVGPDAILVLERPEED